MRRSVQRLLLSARGDRRYEYLSEYERLQWLPPEELARIQLDNLRHLVRHAYETTVYYREAFKKLGLQPDDIKSREDFARLPLLTKEIIKGHRNDLVSDVYPRSALLPNMSGGSTGEPLSFFQHLDVYERMYANQMLALKMAGAKGTEHVVRLWGNPKDHGQPSIKKRLREMITKTTNLNAYNYSEQTIGEWIKVIQGKGETFIYGYVSVLKDVAEHIRKKGIVVGNVKGVLTSAEQLLPWQRELIEESFRCKAYDQYGSREIPGISGECEQGGMHLFPHSVFVEFVSDEEQPGEGRKIIVTSLTNYAMPFLRYEIGDRALPKAGTCSCGRGFPLMEMKIGRMTDRFVTPDGRCIYGTFFVRQMYGIDGVRNFQFRQKDVRSLDLYIVKGDTFTKDDQDKVAGIEGKIQEGASKEFHLAVHYVDEIPKTIGGKHRHVVSEVES